MPHNASAAAPAFWPVLRPTSLKCITRAFRAETGPHPISVFSVRRESPLICWFSASSVKTAPCVKTCPFGANYYDENGLVRNDPDKCVGCNYCIASCPYDARWSHPITGLPMKCISPGCMEMIKEGKQPACVRPVPAEARVCSEIFWILSLKSLKRSRPAELSFSCRIKARNPNFFVVVSK